MEKITSCFERYIARDQAGVLPAESSCVIIPAPRNLPLTTDAPTDGTLQIVPMRGHLRGQRPARRLEECSVAEIRIRHAEDPCRNDNRLCGQAGAARSVVLDPADPLNVIERVGPVTKVALVRLSVLLTGDAFVHHLKVHHVMARRCLVALGTIFGGRRGMQIPRDPPRGRFVAIGALTPEELLMGVTVGVTASAVQFTLLHGSGYSHAEEVGDVVHHFAR